MSHEIDRILAAASETVWLIDEAKGREIVEVLALRAANGKGQAWSAEEQTPVYAAGSVQGRSGSVHVINLHGAIMPRGGMLQRMSGATSLEQFGKAFDVAATDQNAQAIVIDVNSPGGAVDLVAETAEKIYSARRADRPIIAVANTLAASAAYWIASAADELVITPSGTTGSIGIFGMHDDVSQALEKVGIKRTIIRAGARKAEGLDGPLDEAGMRHRQASANYAYDMFVKAVARNRGVDVAVVRADPETEKAHFGAGRSYHAREAVRLGMADRVATFDETLARLARGKPRSARTERARLALI